MDLKLPQEYEWVDISDDTYRSTLEQIVYGSGNINVIGRAGCLTGDTVIRYNRSTLGRTILLKDLYLRFNKLTSSYNKQWREDIVTYVRSYDEETNIVKLNKVERVFESGIKEIYQLELEDGKFLKGTYDHKIMTTHGWIQLGELTIKDYVLVDNVKKGMKTSTMTKEKKFKSKKKNNDKRKRIGMYYPNKRVSAYKKDRTPCYSGIVHILTYEAFLNNCSIEDIINASHNEDLAKQFIYVDTKLYAIHHKDENHQNNDITNLEMLTHKQHQILHSDKGQFNFKYGIPDRVKVKSVVKLPDKEMTYDITCADPHHSFVANNIIVHNCGKSVMLKAATKMLTQNGYNVVLLSSTGIAAVNISSEGIPATTIHSFFKIPPLGINPLDSTKLDMKNFKLINAVDIFIIDEVSMVSSQLFDFVIETLKEYKNHQMHKMPRIILFSDILQLAPVIENSLTVKKYYKDHYQDNIFFFNSKAFDELDFKTIQLTHIFRQADYNFQAILNRIREGTQTNEDLAIINEYVIDEPEYYKSHELYMNINTTNAMVNKKNEEYYNTFTTEPRLYNAYINGSFDVPRNSPLQLVTKLRAEAQIMCIKNNNNFGYQNGSLGKIVRVFPNSVEAILDSGKHVSVQIEKWSQFDYNMKLNDSGKIEPFVKGTFQQIGCKIASCISTHKSQGNTFDNIYFDAEGHVFADSIIYVALSRLRTLGGLGLKRPIQHKDVRVNKEALKFLEELK